MGIISIQKPGKVVTRKGVKQVGKATSGEHTILVPWEALEP